MKCHRMFLLAAVVVGLSVPASADLGKCQKGIAKETQKLHAKIFKALGKCADSYQKAVSKGDPLSSVTGKCNDTLAKVINMSDPGSAIGKAKGKLDGLAGDKCTDGDLGDLGHLTTSTFGDRWARWVLISAWKAGYEQALQANADLITIMRALNAAGGCPLCAQVQNAPCFTHSCILDGTSASNVVSAGAPIVVPLAGSMNMSVCNVPSVFPANEYAVVGSPSLGLDTTVVIPGLAWACVRGFRSEGYITCGGAAPKVSYTACQDHTLDVAGSLVIDECETGAPNEVCQPDTVDIENPAILNGGSCLTTTTAGAVSGDAFLLTSSQIQVILSTERGTDTIPCTSDDTPATVTAIALVPQTTGTASATVIDRDNVEGATINGGPVTGAAFNCAEISTSNASGAKVVSVLPALNALLGNDVITVTTFSCN